MTAQSSSRSSIHSGRLWINFPTFICVYFDIFDILKKEYPIHRNQSYGKIFRVISTKGQSFAVQIFNFRKMREHSWHFTVSPRVSTWASILSLTCHLCIIKECVRMFVHYLLSQTFSPNFGLIHRLNHFAVFFFHFSERILRRAIEWNLIEKKAINVALTEPLKK